MIDFGPIDDDMEEVGVTKASAPPPMVQTIKVERMVDERMVEWYYDANKSEVRRHDDGW